ncbi:hypothetical protein GYN07_32185 (plasmid) [Rhizobium leguminosarum bv. viciae 248]|nr:hypothetical protein GYN07_32185 [Rhizobium leguminosarum bv. viciae 248]
MSGISRKDLLAIWHLLDRYLRDGAELGAEFSAYRLDLALGALQQDLDRSAVSLPQADIKTVLRHAA